MKKTVALLKVITTLTGDKRFSSLASLVTGLGILSELDTGRQVTLTTWSARRWFYHNLYVWNEDDIWEEVGESRSAYYYRHYQSTYYNKIKQEWDGEYKGETHSNGYAPYLIESAEHYKNYPALHQIAYDAWVNNKWFSEQGY